MWWQLERNAQAATLAQVATPCWPCPLHHPVLSQPQRINRDHIFLAHYFNSQGLNSCNPLELIMSVHTSLHKNPQKGKHCFL